MGKHFDQFLGNDIVQNKLLTLHILRNREINIVLFSSNLSNLLEGLLTPADASAAAGAAMTKADLASLLHPLKTGHSRRHKRTNTQLNKDTSENTVLKPKPPILWFFGFFSNKNGQNDDFQGLKLLRIIKISKNIPSL